MGAAPEASRCDGTGLTAYMPEGDRSWPDTFPVANMKMRQTYCHMEGVTQEKVLNPLNALEILEGQVALVHHIMAFEEANPAVHILAPRQKWKATFLAYFLGAVSQGQLTIMKQLGDEAYAAGLADQNCWHVRTSKRLIYLLRHSKDTSLGRYNDALFENIDRDLQAFRWAPHKILGFLLGNTKSRFTVHVQLRRLDYDDVPSIDWYISRSAVQGHSRVSDIADPSTLGEPLTLDRCRALGYIFHATHNKNWEQQVVSGRDVLERKAFPWERNPRSQGQQEALLWERDLVQAHHLQLEALLLRRDQMLIWALLLSTWTTCGK